MIKISTLEFQLTKRELYDGYHKFYLTVIRNGEVIETDWFTIENGRVHNDLMCNLEKLLSYSFDGIDPEMQKSDYIRLIELFGYTI